MWEQLARIYQPVSRRYFGFRPVATAAYHLGEQLTRRGAVMETTLPSGSPICLDMRDHGHRAVFFSGELEPAATGVFREIVGPGSVVLDVGANVGYYSLLSRDLGAAVVHAFEPNPAVRRLFAHSLKCRPERIILSEMACGETSGTLDLFLPDASGNVGIATLSQAHAASDDAIKVPVVTLDDYCMSHGLKPTLIKIDVEGFEAPVLRGATKTLAECKPTVVCEVRDEDARAQLSRMGYQEILLARNDWYSDSLFRHPAQIS